MMYNREGGFGEKVRSYYLPGNTPAPPPEHRAHGSTSNAAEELINLTHLLFSARGGGAPPVEEGGYLLRLHGLLMAAVNYITAYYTNGQFVYIHQSIGLISRITCHCRCSNVQRCSCATSSPLTIRLGTNSC